MTYPKELTNQEWDFLNKLTSYNGMDCWFSLRTKFPTDNDYVYDIEEKKEMSLHDAIKQVAEGLVEEDLEHFTYGCYIWNDLMDKFGLLEFIVNCE